MSKIVFSRVFDLANISLGDFGAATITATATSVTYTLGTKRIVLNGSFTLAGSAPQSGTAQSLTYFDSTLGTAAVFNVTGLGLAYSSFQLAVGNDDLSAVFGVGNDWVVGSGGNDKLRGYAGSDLLQGMSGNDILYGSYGDDTLDGGAGVDTMQGGSGNDVYIVNVTADKPVEFVGGGTDTVETGLATYTLGAQVENLTYTGVSNFVGTGNALHNLIIGGRGNDRLYGLGGNDTLRGGNGHDTLDGGIGNDYLIGDSAASFVTTSASTYSPSDPTLPISLSMTLPEIVATGSSSTAVTGYINNASLGGGLFNLAFVLDVSGSMSGTFSGSTVGDVNGDGDSNTKVDAAIAAFRALVDSIKAAGLGNMVRIALIPFDDYSDIRSIGTAVSDANGNGIADVIDAALDLDDGGGTEYTAGLNKAIEFFNTSPTGDNFVFFLSDGAPNSQNYAAQLASLRSDTGINATIRSIGIEAGDSGYYDVLDLLDDGLANDSAIDVQDPASLSAGLLSSQVNVADILKLEIYKNGTLLTTLTPAQLTQTPFGLKYSYTINGLSTTAADKIETRLILKDGASSFISTSQYISVGNLVSNDSLIGGAGNDTLDGGAGNDTLVGGTGDDTYMVNSTTKTIVEAAGAGTDTVESTVTYSLSNAAHANIENLSLLGSSNINGTGNALGNRIEGNIGNNILTGLGGNDTLIGGFGTDTANYGPYGAAVVVNLSLGTATSGAKTDTLSGIENVWGSAFADYLTGDAGNNTFRGNGGNDTMSGGSGLDTVDYSTATSAVTVVLNSSYSGGTGSSANGGEGNDVLGSDVEGVIGSRFADSISDAGYSSYYGATNLFSGGAGADTLDGGVGNDTLIGGAGNDSLIGGTGNDLVDYSYSTQRISGNIAGNMLVGSSETDSLSGFEWIIGTSLADSIAGSAADEKFEGGAGNDTLIGGAGNDTLDGGAGVDSMVGGAGNDTYYLNLLSDKAVEAAGGGVDTMIVDIASGTGTFALGNLEHATLLGSANIHVTGNAANNTILGNDGNNRLLGEAGDDSMLGGAGNDTLDGGAGNDTLNGGDGVDLLDYSGSAAAVSGTLNSSITSGTFTDNTSYFENVTGSGYNDSITGDYNDNVLFGGNGHDTLDGGYGNDSVSGGNGNDSLNGGSGNDTLAGGVGVDLLDGDYGTDTVSYAHLGTGINAELSTGVVINAQGTDTLVEIEQIIGTGANDVIVWTGTTYSYTGFILDGRSGNDRLQGNYGNDTLSGGAGNDTLDGGIYGTDYADYSSASAGVRVNLGVTTAQNTVGAGTDTLASIEGIIGSAFADTLTGMTTGTNYFVGGVGVDTLNGGAGYDYFVYNSVNDSTAGSMDTINNFTGGSYYDKINLSAIDANTTDSYDYSSFSFIGSAVFSGTAGELRSVATSTNTFIYGDVNGDKVADLAIRLTGAHTLAASDFYL